MAIDGAIAQHQENAGTVNHARGMRRIWEKECTDFDVRVGGGLATSGLLNGGVSRWLPPVAAAAKGDLAVTQRGAGANMSVDVGQGGALVGGTASATQGNYFVYNDAAVNLAIAAADATNPRIDVVGIQIRDTEYGEAATDCRLVVVTGTPAGSPAVPALPAEFLTLAHVAVAALAATITNSVITDKRISSGTGIVTCTSASRPTNQLYPGQLIYETDTNKLQQYTTSTTLWTPPWNLPWGDVAAPALIVVNQTGIGAGPTAFTGFTLTVQTVTNRRYEIRFSAALSQVTSGGQVSIFHYLGGAQQARIGNDDMTATTERLRVGFVTFAGTGNNETRDIRGGTTAGTLSILNATTANGLFTWRDNGPNAAPA